MYKFIYVFFILISFLLNKNLHATDSKNSNSSNNIKFKEDNDIDNNQENSTLPAPKEKKIILSIDGGGIRGLIPAIVLDELEKKLSKEFKSDIRISDFIDFYAGTSTGSIVSLGLARPDQVNQYRSMYKAEVLVNLYKEEGKKIFGQEWWREARSYLLCKHPNKVLEALLTERFQNTLINQSIRNVDVFVPAYNLTQNKPYFFDSQDARSKDVKFKMRDVTQASSSAPTYLPATEIKETGCQEVDDNYFVDGGVFMNNPALASYMKAKKFFPDQRLVLISIGTGEEKNPLPVDTLKNAGKLMWAPHFPNVAMGGESDSSHQLLLLNNDSKNLTYYRLQPELEKAVLDDVSEKSIQALIKTAKDLTKTAEFQKIFDLLSNICKQKRMILENTIEKINSENFVHANLSDLLFSKNLWENLFNKLKGPSTLTKLTLKRSSIDAEKVKEIAGALKSNTTLTSLDLSENGIGQGVAYLGKLLEINTTIKELIIKNNGINAGSSIELRALLCRKNQNNPTSLILLDLEGNKIGFQGFKEILVTLKRTDPKDSQQINLEDNGIIINLAISQDTEFKWKDYSFKQKVVLKVNSKNQIDKSIEDLFD